MKNINCFKLLLFLANLLLLFLTTAIASDQQSVADAQVTFHVA